MIKFQWIQKVVIDHHRESGYLSNVTADMSGKVYYSISQKTNSLEPLPGVASDAHNKHV